MGLLVTGSKVNYRTDLTSYFGQLVLVQTNDVGTEGMPVKKNEFVIALNRAANTKGGVWVYRRGHKKAVVRRVLKAVPITEDWKQHMNELAKEKPINRKQFFEFDALRRVSSDPAER